MHYMLFHLLSHTAYLESWLYSNIILRTFWKVLDVTGGASCIASSINRGACVISGIISLVLGVLEARWSQDVCVVNRVGIRLVGWLAVAGWLVVAGRLWLAAWVLHPSNIGAHIRTGTDL